MEQKCQLSHNIIQITHPSLPPLFPSLLSTISFLLSLFSPLLLLFHLLQLRANAKLCMVISAYNTNSDNWEPVLEPLVIEDNDINYYPWILQMTVCIIILIIIILIYTNILLQVDKQPTVGIKQSPFAINITAENALQLTVTKSSITMVLALAKVTHYYYYCYH